MVPCQQRCATNNVAIGEQERFAEAGSSSGTASAPDGQVICWSTANRMFWLFAWLGTAVSGGVFGMFYVVWAFFNGEFVAGTPILFAVPFALYASVVGTAFAGAMAIPLHISAAIATWALWLIRFRVAIATVAGVATGGLSATVSMDGSSEAIVLAGAAGLIGGLGTFASLHWYQTRTEGGRWLRRMVRIQSWRFSLSDMLRHFAVLGILFACWAWVINTIFVTRERPLQPNEVRMHDPSNAIPAKPTVMAP